MSVSEHDLETLEVWLDGELPEEQAQAMQQRIALEPALSQTLEQLRSDRALRTNMWQTMEPAESEIQTLVASVRRSMRKEDLINSRLRMFRNVSGIAASIALIFMTGWMSRGRLIVGTPVIGPIAQKTVLPVPRTPETAGTQNFSNPRPGGGNATLVSAPSAGAGGTVTYNNGTFEVTLPNPNAPASFPVDQHGFSMLKPGFTVQVRSPSGVIYTKELENLSGFSKFSDEIASFEEQQVPSWRLPGPRLLRPGSDQAVPVSETWKP